MDFTKALKGIAGKRLTYRGPAPVDIPSKDPEPWRHPRFKARKRWTRNV
jgi:hypothetical protein